MQNRHTSYCVGADLVSARRAANTVDAICVGAGRVPARRAANAASAICVGAALVAARKAPPTQRLEFVERRAATRAAPTLSIGRDSLDAGRTPRRKPPKVHP